MLAAAAAAACFIPLIICLLRNLTCVSRSMPVSTEGAASVADRLLAEIPDHPQWCTFTLSAASFPDSMAGVEAQSYKKMERTDWIAWRDRRHAIRTELPTLPTYSDGVVQNPRGVEGYDPRIMGSSACIRYLAGDDWLLVKGRGTKVEPRPCNTQSSPNSL